jgi:hypothetical protein
MVSGVDSQGNPTNWVMDPSLSPSTVTTRDEWLNVTTGNGRLDKWEARPGDDYFPIGPYGSGGYGKDHGQVDDRINEYRRRLAAGQHIEPDPNLSSKVGAKESFPTPVVHPTHVP